MKEFIALLVGLMAPLAWSFEWEGGIRENFITRDSYNYNADTTARIIHELIDRGHKGISLHPRIAWSEEKSLFFLPPVKTSLFDLSVANTRILQAGGKLTLRPTVFENPGLGEAVPSERIRPKRSDLAIISYEQIMTQFAQISRQYDLNRLVIGSGIVHLLKDPEMVPRFENMLKHIRKISGLKTELVLEVVGTEDLQALTMAMKNETRPLKINDLINGISLVADPATHFPDGTLNTVELTKTRFILEALFPKLPVHLARVGVPGCAKPGVLRDELVCGTQKGDVTLQLARFQKLKAGLLSLEDQSVRFGSVEILEANTDYEPDVIDARYPYYHQQFRDPKIYELPAREPQTAPAWPLPVVHGKKKGCIYFDHLNTPIGEIHAMMLQSVLGAFRSWEFTRTKVTEVRSEELKSCEVIFYLAINFSQVLPPGFLEELAKSSKKIPVVWFNYRFTQFADVLKKNNIDPGFDAPIVIQPDSVPSPENENPGFYSQFDYKGETFSKMSKWNRVSNSFESSPEINLINVADPSRVEVLSTARHNKTNNSIPYAVRSGNVWYLADSPFTFVNYEGRFYIFCDLLWDILKETPPKEKIALVRIEDVHPLLEESDLKWVSDYLSSQKVPFTIAMIPFYSDLFRGETRTTAPIFKPADKFERFVGQMKYAQSRGADFVMHGTVHSVGCLISGYDGLSGADYEFWLYPENTPLPFDGVDWVTRRLEMGIDVFRKMGIRPVGFEAPHYAASVLDYLIFAKMFQWQYHRSIFVPFSIQKDTGLPKHLRAFECDPAKCGDERRSILNNIKVTADYKTFGGIASPFITYKDVYGQSIIPETLGMVDFAFYSSNTWRPISKPEDILRRAKKLRVIRGAVASFFWHPLNLEPVSVYYQQNPGSYEAFGGKKSLTMVIEGLRDMGYAFKSTNDKTLFPDEVL